METAYGLPKKREAVVKALQDAYTEGNLEETEFENRLTIAYEAKTLADLKEVIYDFPALIQSEIFPEKRSTRTPRLNTDFTNGERSIPAASHVHRVLLDEDAYPIAVFSGKMERFYNLLGTLNILAENAQLQADSCHIHLDCWLGNTKINLVNPELAGREVHLYIHGGLGEVKIAVPPGTQISRRINLVLSEFSHKKKGHLMGMFRKEKQPLETDMAFHLIIHGSFVLGNVQVRY